MTLDSDTPDAFGSNETTPAGNSSGSQDSTGEILRKERIKRRISIDTIARDLKINQRYIKALESGDKGNLPATPYVRVYLRSIAKYLMLDSQQLLAQFYREYGITSEFRDGSETKLEVSMRKKQAGRPAPSLALLVLALVVIAGALLVARLGLRVSGTDSGAYPAEVPSPDPDSLPGALDDEDLLLVPPDTLGAAETSSVVGEIVEENTEDVAAVESRAAPPGKLRLTIRAVDDSVWVQVFSDGTSWRNFIHPGNIRAFSARDSFNVRAGNNANLRYTLNGKPLTTIRGRGVVTFRVDHKGVENWPLATWTRVFKNRS